MTDKSEMIFGVRAVIEAIQAGKEIDKILVKKDIQSDLSKELFAALKETLIPVQRVPVERINRITRKNVSRPLLTRRRKIWFRSFSSKARTPCLLCWMV